VQPLLPKRNVPHYGKSQHENNFGYHDSAANVTNSELGSSELLQRANFLVALAIAPLFFEKNNGCGSELSPFYRYRYSLLRREW